MSVPRKVIVALVVLLSVVSIVAQMEARQVQPPDGVVWTPAPCWVDTYGANPPTPINAPVEPVYQRRFPYLPQRVRFYVDQWRIPSASWISTKAWAYPVQEHWASYDGIMYKWVDAASEAYCFTTYWNSRHWMKIFPRNSPPGLRGWAVPNISEDDDCANDDDGEEEWETSLSPERGPLLYCGDGSGGEEAEDEHENCEWYYYEISYDGGETWELFHAEFYCEGDDEL